MKPGQRLIHPKDNQESKFNLKIPEKETHEEMTASKAPSSSNQQTNTDEKTTYIIRDDGSVTEEQSAENRSSRQVQQMSQLQMKVQRSMQQKSNPSASTEHLAEIVKILQIDTKLRSLAQSQLLSSYLQQFDYFKNTIEDDDDAYIHLSKAVQVQKCDPGYEIITEGDDGDTFYFILEGRVNVLKAQMMPINTSEVLNSPASDSRDQAWIRAYYYAIRDNF